MKVLIAGAGYVGRKTQALLLEREHEVLCIRRSPPALPGFFNADASTGRGLEQLPSDIDQIIVAISPDARDDDAYKRAYPDVVRTLTRHFPSARLLLVSSTAVYSQEGGEDISDESQTSPGTFSAQRILEAEQALLARSSSSIVVRASGIYGPDRIATISRLAHVELDEAEQNLWTNRIHRDDLARALVFLSESQDAHGVYLATDPCPATLGEIQAWLRKQPAHKLLPAPRAGRSERSRRSRRMYPKRLLSAGFSFVYESFRDGYEPIVAGFKET